MHLALGIRGFPPWLVQVEAKFGNQIGDHSHHAAFHPGLAGWKRIWLLGTLLNQTKLPPRQARWRAAMWNRRRDLVARRGFHPRKVDGVPGNTEQSYSTLCGHEQKWHNSKVKYTLVNTRFFTAQAYDAPLAELFSCRAKSNMN